MCSVAVRHTASPAPPPVPLEGDDVEGLTAGALDGAGADDAGADDGARGGAVAVEVTVTVAVGGAAGWLDDAEPQAATSDAAATAPVSHAPRRARRDVLAAITRLAAPAQPVVVAVSADGTRARGRGYVGIACSFVRRYG
jgi:hypothetical protein